MSQDILYIADIPSDYHYVVFQNDYVTLYNQPSARNETLTYYRIFLNASPGTYISGTQQFGNYTQHFTDYPVSNSFLYRSDLDKILICVFIIVLFFIFITNIMTSIFRKGGVFGGLL